MKHPAELVAGMDKRAWFWQALPWLMMAAPFATQLVDKFRGGSPTGEDPFKQLQVPGYDEAAEHNPYGLSKMTKQYVEHSAPHKVFPALHSVSQGLQKYRAGA